MKILLSDGKEIYLDGYLKSALDSIAWNVSKDWDFVIIVTGDGMVRTGKSVLAMNIGAYLADKLKTPYTLEKNVCFDSQVMIDNAHTAPPNSVFVYDEAFEGLATAHRFTKIQQDLVTFFVECGQLNHIFLLVLPDFFSLNWELATNRSECLINVYRTDENYESKKEGKVTVFKRGQFAFYNRINKAKLYWKVKKTGIREYKCIRPNFVGSFTNNYPLDETEYRSKKREALGRFRKRAEQSATTKEGKELARHRKHIGLLLNELREHKLMTTLSRKFGMSRTYYQQYLKEMIENTGFSVENAVLDMQTGKFSQENSEKPQNLGEDKSE